MTELIQLHALWNTFPADFVVKIGNYMSRPRAFTKFVSLVGKKPTTITLYRMEFQAVATPANYKLAKKAAATYSVQGEKLYHKPTPAQWKICARNGELIRFYNK